VIGTVSKRILYFLYGKREDGGCTQKGFQVFAKMETFLKVSGFEKFLNAANVGPPLVMGQVFDVSYLFALEVVKIVKS